MVLTTFPKHLLEFELLVNGSELQEEEEEESVVELILSNNNSEGRPVGWAFKFDDECPLKSDKDSGVIGANCATHVFIRHRAAVPCCEIDRSCSSSSPLAVRGGGSLLIRWVELSATAPVLSASSANVVGVGSSSCGAESVLDESTSALLLSSSISVHQIRLDIVVVRRVQLCSKRQQVSWCLRTSFEKPAEHPLHFMDQLANLHYYGAIEAARCEALRERLEGYKSVIGVHVNLLKAAGFCAVASLLATYNRTTLVLGVIWTTALLGTHLSRSLVVQIVRLILTCLLLYHCFPEWGVVLGLLLAAGTYLPLLQSRVNEKHQRQQAQTQSSQQHQQP